MADAASHQLIDRIVQDKIQAGEMFTAYDVTLEARRRGGNVRHNDVRDLVHEFFEQGRFGAGYNRSLIDVGAPVKPFLYHRFSDDPNQYKPSPPAVSPPPTNPIRRLLGRLFGQSDPTPPPAIPRKPPQRQSVLVNLDASMFLPISSDDLKKEGRKLGNLWNSPWFGRRDLIPPADDPRTQLIDRAMVTHGLLTPEQLIAIHQVGAEMDRLRPDIIALRHQAAQAGSAAVEEERKQKAQIKANKKAESAERKKQRAEAVARRKATDILFLGRGVSARLGDRQSNSETLRSLALPVLSTPADLAQALNLTIPQLRWLAFHAEVATRVHYVTFTVPKRSGGTRQLNAPHRLLLDVQGWILDHIVNRLPVESAAQGFLVGRSILTNAQPHVGKAVVVNMDLESFFPSITFPRVRSVYERVGYSPAVATLLALLCTECPRRLVEYAGRTYYVATGPRGLPQGAPTSPGLSNQVARRLDRRLGGLAAKLNLTYTRYADDLTFSGGPDLNERVGYLMACVRHIAQEERFAVNEKKSRVLRRNTAQIVTGLVVNDRVGVPREEVRRIRAILHRAQAEGLDAQNRDHRPHFLAWLRGKIAYIRMSRPEAGARLQGELEKLLR